MILRISVMPRQLCSPTKTQATGLLPSLLFHLLSPRRIRVPFRTSSEQCRLWHSPSPRLPSSSSSSSGNNPLPRIHPLCLHISLVPPRHEFVFFVALSITTFGIARSPLSIVSKARSRATNTEKSRYLTEDYHLAASQAETCRRRSTISGNSRMPAPMTNSHLNER